MAIQAAKLLVEVGADTRDAEKGIDGFGKKLNSAAKNLTSTGLGLSAAFTAPLLGIAAAALDSAGGFQQSMNVLQQVAGASESTMASLTAEALRLGAVTSFSAGEAADAMLELGKAGLDTDEIMASIGGVLDLAAAGGIGLAEAASVTAAALNAFGLEASESTRIANLLAAGANASAADITDLSQGLKQAGFAFSLADQPIESLVASLALLTNVGLTGSDAGTALKNAFIRMINPTAEAAALMKDLGISFYDAAGNMRQLPDIIDIINVATAGLTDEQRNAALATIFLSDGMKAMVPLLDAGSEGFNTMVAEVTKAGAATEVAEARMSGFRGGIEYLKGSIDSFLIGTALPFLDTLGGFARATGDVISAFGGLPQPVINATLAFAGVLAAAGPLLLVLGGVSAALAFLISPLGLVVTTTAALAAAWAADMGGIQGKTAEVFSAVQAWFASTAAGAQALAGSIAAAFGNTQFPSLQTLWEQFKAGDFQAVADTIRNTAFDLMVNLDTELNISGQANQLKQQLIGAVTGLGAAISGLDFSGAKANLNGLRDGILGGLTTAVDGVDWAQGGTTFAGMINGLTTSVQSLDFSGINWADALKRGLLVPVGAALGALEWVFGSGEFEGLKTSIKGAIATIPWGEIGTSFVELGAAIGAHLAQIGTDMAGSISGAFAPITSAVTKFFAGLTLPELPKITFESVFSGAADIINGMTAAINGQDWEAIGTNFVSTITSSVATAFTNAGKGLAAAGLGIAAAFDATVSFFSNLPARLSGTSAALGGWLSTVAADITAAFQASGLAEAFTGLGSALDSALRGFLTGAQASIVATVSGASKGIGNAISGAWSSFVAVIPEFKWADYVTSLTGWSDFVSSLTWSDFVSSLGWGTFVSSISWSTFISSLSWSTFISSISWSSFIPDFSWGDWVPSLDWTRFIPFFGAPAQNATGTNYFPGGMSWVGERGPELVSLPRGSRIYNNRDSMAMAGGGVNININVASIDNDMDLESLANKVARKFQQRVR